MMNRRQALGVIVCFFLTAPAFASPAQLKEGNRLFKNGNYEKALKLYEDALVDTPHSSLLKFNAGDAAYQSGDFPKAANYFKDADQSTLPGLTGAARYNLGNALFKQDNLPDAIEAYKNALRTNPADEDARYNLSVALRRSSQKPPSSKGKAKDKKDSGGKKKEDKSDAPQDAQGPKPGQMSREDAERLLSAASAGEMKKAQRQQKPENAKTDEDW